MYIWICWPIFGAISAIFLRDSLHQGLRGLAQRPATAARAACAPDPGQRLDDVLLPAGLRDPVGAAEAWQFSQKMEVSMMVNDGS